LLSILKKSVVRVVVVRVDLGKWEDMAKSYNCMSTVTQLSRVSVQGETRRVSEGNVTILIDKELINVGMKRDFER
jgi:hypothetical protein